MQIESRQRFRILRSWDEDGLVFLIMGSCISYAFTHGFHYSCLLDFVVGLHTFVMFADIEWQRLSGYKTYHQEMQEIEKRYVFYSCFPSVVFFLI